MTTGDREHARTVLKQYKKLVSVILYQQATRNETCDMLKILDKLIASDYTLYKSLETQITLVWRLVSGAMLAFENDSEKTPLLRTRLRFIIAVCEREIVDTLDEHGIPF